MQTPGNSSFYRGSNRIVGGVCSGLAEGFHVDVLWVRLAFVVLAFVQGIGVVLYVVLWFLMPERTPSRPPGQTAFQSMKNDLKRAWTDLMAQFGGPRSTTSSAAPGSAGPTPTGTAHETPSSAEAAPAAPSPPYATTRNPSFVLGAIFIALGIAFLAANTHLLEWSVIWPVALVALGIALLVRNLERRS